MFASSLALGILSLSAVARGAFSDTGPYPASYGVFSSAFSQPPIPKVRTEYQGSWLQHKWNDEVSHISSGFWYNSASQGKVRVDESYEGTFGSSLFDYTNTSHHGLVSNRQWLVGPSVGSRPQCFSQYIAAPGFPVISSSLLITSHATFGGVVLDPYVGYSQTWDFLAGSISVTAYLDTNNTLLGYDFFGESQRTKAITRFYNIIVGPIEPDVFSDFPC